MSKIFTIIGDQKENGTWRKPRPMFVGRVVIDDDGEVLGYAAFGNKFTRGIYGVSLPQDNGDYAIAFALMANLSTESQTLLFRCDGTKAHGYDLAFVEGKDTPNGICITIDENPPKDDSADDKSAKEEPNEYKTPKITSGESRVKLSEQPFNEKAAMETCKRARQTNLGIGANAEFFNNYDFFKDWLLQVPGVLQPEVEDEKTA